MTHTTVFVYGTLKRGGYLDIRRHVPYAEFVAPAEVQGEIRERGVPYLLPYGAQIINASHPSAVFSSHDQLVTELMPHIRRPQGWNGVVGIPTVKGELWRVSKSGTEILDAIEGVARHRDGSVNPALCHYLPVWMSARYNDESYGAVFTDALAYAYNVLDGPARWQGLYPLPGGTYPTALRHVLR